MELQVKQWRSQLQNESEQQVSATKFPNFQIQSQTATSPDSSSSSRFLEMGNFFSWKQWQELELQALIYRYMLAGASVPQELLLPIKKSLITESPLHFFHQPSWYWGRGTMDSEPGRCKRTDGKKWRCSRDVVAGHKYCDRHIHRGRNRSRKPMETTPTVTAAASSFVLGEELGHGDNNIIFSSGSSHSSSQYLHLSNNQSCSSEMKQESFKKKKKITYEAQSGFNNGRSDNNHILRHFFDDWPRSSDSINSTTCHLSTSMSSNTSSDVSLKLSTGNNERESLNWWSNGGSQQNMGGPLAEALRSASSASSVLHQMGVSTQVFH